MDARARSDTVVHVFVKICGITSEEDALLAVALGADALGFVFAPGSPRQITPTDVRAIVHRLPPGTTTVGVFRDELHGREPVSEVRWVRERLRLVIQGFAAGDPALAATGDGPADIVLIDAPDPGSGRAFDWALAEGVPPGVRVLLAGGLTVRNVADAVRRVRPWGVDVSTGVETSPGSGRKDARRLRRFIETARRAGADLKADGWTPDSDAAAFDWQLDG